MNALDKNDGVDPREDMSDDMLEQANKRAAPRLQLASSFSPGLIAGIAGIALLGVFTFSNLSASRIDDTSNVDENSNPQETTEVRTIAPVRPRDPVPVLIEDSFLDEPFEQDIIDESQFDDQARLESPALVVDLTKPPRNNPRSTSPAGQSNASGSTGFLADNQTQVRESSQARRLDNISDIVPEGSVIAGTLETTINSDLPGHLRAVVSRDVMGFDGRKVLIPKGSRLVGQYQSELATGQRRVLVIWERLIRNDGVSIRLDSPGTDALGQAGVTGKVKSHFFRRFGSAVLLSVIQAGTSRAVSGNNGIFISGGAGATSVATSGLERNLDIPPTIKVAAGASIRIFLSRDLDFSAINDPAP